MTGTNAMPGCGANWRPSPARSPTQVKAQDMMSGTRRSSSSCRVLTASIFVAANLFASVPASSAEPSDIESGLTRTIDLTEQQASLAEAMAALNIPAASIALIDQDRIVFAHAY